MDSLENEQNKNRLQLFFIVSLVAYFFWFSQLPPPVQQNVDTVAVNNPNSVNTVVNTMEKAEEKSEIVSVDANSVKVAYTEQNVQTPFQSTMISSKNGSVSNISLQEYKVIPQTQSWWGWILSGMKDSWKSYQGGQDNLAILSTDAQLLVIGEGDSIVEDVYTITKLSDSSVQATATINNMVVTKTYNFHSGEASKTADKYTIDIQLSITNNRSTEIYGLWVGMFDTMVDNDGRFDNISRPQFYVEDELVGTFGTMFSTSFASLQDLEEPTKFSTEPEWFGIGSRYFLSAIAPLKSGTFADISTYKRSDSVYGSVAHLKSAIDPGATRTIDLIAYVGPRQMDILEGLGDSWMNSVEYGMFGFFSRVLLFMLKVIYAGFNNWGVAILLLTLVVKVIFFPLTQKAFVSGKKMQMIQPQLNEIKEKYKDNQQLQAQETMKLFSENGVSPFGGCLPSLVQIPVWLALYNVMYSSVELYNSHFLYLQDLTSMDPYGVLPVLYIVLMFIQQQMTPMVNMDPAQQTMLKVMPLIFGVFMFTFPSGLVLYFSMNMLLTIFQQWLIKIQFESKNPVTA